ncbi:hypothetical protein GCM10011325_09660 [Dyadobacter sediminis]|uniref:Uncharacterized protein n=2 Tax=Dyadobacter sediminis TaxID=1493691 RepID=A0A5R9KL71_9BACT|nr:hypothetical protein FEM55_05935 [Dyadobacter sediminis]GGB84136.1 hypothetical protein GCM10011325_09660 [Dyadobacter sediminis]
MTHEKIITLKTGRSVKVIVHETKQLEVSELNIDVLIKEPNEPEFRRPINDIHPQYWKLRKLDHQHASKLQIVYSGIKKKHIKSAINEFYAVNNWDSYMHRN